MNPAATRTYIANETRLVPSHKIGANRTAKFSLLSIALSRVHKSGYTKNDIELKNTSIFMVTGRTSKSCHSDQTFYTLTFASPMIAPMIGYFTAFLFDWSAGKIIIALVRRSE